MTQDMGYAACSAIALYNMRFWITFSLLVTCVLSFIITMNFWGGLTVLGRAKRRYEKELHHRASDLMLLGIVPEAALLRAKIDMQDEAHKALKLV
jgi:hypothetical protein